MFSLVMQDLFYNYYSPKGFDKYSQKEPGNNHQDVDIWLL